MNSTDVQALMAAAVVPMDDATAASGAPAAIDPAAVDWAFDIEVGALAADDGGDVDPAHPLNVTSATLPHMGWLTDFENAASTLTLAPVSFSRLTGLALLAMALGRDARLRMSFGTVYANIYGAIVGESTVWHKSTALAKVGNMAHRAQLENYLLPNDFTTEGLLRALTSQPHGLIVRDEVSRLFGSHNVKYLSELKTFITDLYDCRPVKRQKADEAWIVGTPYVNIIGATTPAAFYSAVNGNDWHDGFLVRWLFALPEGAPDFRAGGGLITSEQDDLWGTLAARLTWIAAQKECDFALAPDAFDYWNEWRAAGLETSFEYRDDVALAFTGRYATYALKFALILAASRGEWGTVTLETMRDACALADYYKAAAYRLMTDKTAKAISADVLQKAYKFVHIRAQSGTPAQSRDLQRKMTIDRGRAAEILDTLCDRGAVIRSETDKGKTVYVPADSSRAALPVKSG